MLRFNEDAVEIRKTAEKNFNTSYVTVQQLLPNVKNEKTKISIHPMLRFNGNYLDPLESRRVFQYILCYGSTLLLFLMFFYFNHFNTSYVTVQQRKISLKFPPLRFQYILCYGSTFKGFGKPCSSSKISIHPMLRFNF